MENFRINKDSSIICNNIEIDAKAINKRVVLYVSALKIRKICKEIPIIIALDRTHELIIAILSALEYGCPFLPIDFTMPMDRINYMMSDSNVNTVITSKEHADKFIGKYVIMIEDLHETYEGLADDNYSDIAYVLYTSGSTGKPKGVEVTRNGFINFINGVSDIIDFSVGKRIACLTTVSFDIFFLESIMALIKGLTVVLANEDEQRNPKLMAKLIAEQNVDMIQMTPSRMQLLLNHDKNLSCLKKVKEIMIGGEPFSLSLLTALQKNTSAKIYNMYGPTETTIWSTISELTDKDTIDIGKPIINTQICILDENLNFINNGEVGEICISGDGLARGYINNVEMTGRNFIKLRQNSDIVVYRTGDLGRYLSCGCFEYLGRIDNQVKIRGHRIELEEIEAELNGYEQISQAIVTTIDFNEQDKALMAFYIGGSEISPDEIKIFLLSKLPDYMIPIKYIKVDEFPTTSNGKIDRKELTSNYIDVISESICNLSDYNLSPVEEKVLKITRENIDDKLSIGITIETDFSSIGVDSITFIKIVVSLEEEFDFEFDDEMLLLTAFPHVKSICDYVETKAKI